MFTIIHQHVCLWCWSVLFEFQWQWDNLTCTTIWDINITYWHYSESIPNSKNVLYHLVKYLAFLRKRMNTNPSRGPYHFRAPSRIFWRTVRGKNTPLLFLHMEERAFLRFLNIVVKIVHKNMLLRYIKSDLHRSNETINIHANHPQLCGYQTRVPNQNKSILFLSLLWWVLYLKADLLWWNNIRIWLLSSAGTSICACLLHGHFY